MQKSLKPFLKWAGGKRWFIQNHYSILPKVFNRYIEPFLGSGAVFFYLKPKVALLGDSNKDLIDTYMAIKENWFLVYAYLEKHSNCHSSDYYYQVRLSNPSNPWEKAARLIYLNRSCWNGLYRVNKRGHFNVPIGSKSNILFNDDDFESVAEVLKNAEFFKKDFEFLINQAKEGDFVFADPPYTVIHNNNGFIKYNEKIFSWV